MTTLRSEADGVAARWPVAVLESGGYVTGTYEPGILALWTGSGELLRTFGLGSGEGPGEFEWAAALLTVGDSVVRVFPGLPRWESFSVDGRHLSSSTAPVVGGIVNASPLGAEGFAASVPGLDGSRLLLSFDARTIDVVERASSAVPLPGMLIASHSSGGLWTAQLPEYALQERDPESGRVVSVLAREAPWFSPSGSEVPYLTQVSVDSLGLLWVWSNVPDPDAPSRRPRQDESAVAPKVASRFRDHVLEVLSPGGQLIASRRFDDVTEWMRVVHPNLYVRENDDLLRTLTILEPRLVSNDGS